MKAMSLREAHLCVNCDTVFSVVTEDNKNNEVCPACTSVHSLPLIRVIKPLEDTHVSSKIAAP